MTDKHTPGPWRVDQQKIKGAIGGKDGDGRVIANNAVRESDAQLIAAAPVLLAALREVYRVTSYCFSPTSRDIYAGTLAEQAIEAATGSKPTIEEPPDDQKFETLIKAYQK